MPAYNCSTTRPGDTLFPSSFESFRAWEKARQSFFSTGVEIPWRNIFACAALIGKLASQVDPYKFYGIPDVIAREAFMQADSMLKESQVEWAPSIPREDDDV